MNIDFDKLAGFVACMVWWSTSDVAAQSTGWRIEAESPQTRVLLRGDTVDITTAAGLSLWWAELLSMPCEVSYRACVVVDGGICDRLSDLNSFFMASDPNANTTVAVSPEVASTAGGAGYSPLHGIAQRGGRFVESYRLQCYYLGYGGNYNSTTRFRRYEADTLGVESMEHRPPVLVEYTDSLHLLTPNHWYDIHITAVPEGTAARIRYVVDGKCIIDYLDPSPLLQGWFAIRTTWSHLRLTQFSILQSQ